jgi:hypothetical protein
MSPAVLANPGEVGLSAERLARITTAFNKEIADKALDALKSAHRDGAVKRPETERQLTTARRAIEKAIGVLTRLD